jgi:hypothetical protein
MANRSGSFIKLPLSDKEKEKIFGWFVRDFGEQTYPVLEGDEVIKR